jgi:hypothetical protein
MLAYHPVTGKEIRVIQTDASISKEAKTLWFLGDVGKGWDVVSDKGSCDFRILIEPTTLQEFQTLSHASKLLFMSKRALGEATIEEFKNLRIGNVMALEELHDMYPHVSGPWDGTVEDAAIMVAGLLRYRRLAGVWGERAERLGLVKEEGRPPRLWWVTQFYTPPQNRRRREIRKALDLNQNSKLLDKILLLNERSEEIPAGAVETEQKVIGKRLTYADVFRAAATMPPDVWLVFANADIAIDDVSWRLLWQINMENKFLALLRWDVPDSGRLEDAQIFGPRADSQDTWVIRVADIQARGPEALAKELEVPFGKMGCDNAIALDMLRKKFLVVNPALSIKTYHFHSSELRTYSKTDVVERPFFHYVHPTGLNDLLAVLKPATGAKRRQLSSLQRPVRGGGATKWMSVVNRTLDTDDTPFRLAHTNPLTPDSEVVLELKDCFMNPDGLVFDRERMWIGESVRAQKLWGRTPMNTLTPSLESKKTIVVPWGNVKTREDYVLGVLSKVLRLGGGVRGIVEGGWEFSCPEQKETIEALEVFDWRVGKLPVLKHEEDILIYSREARVKLVPEKDIVCAEDVEALRGSLAGWEEKPVRFGGRWRIVIVEDGSITNDVSHELEDTLEGAWDVKVVFAGRTSAHRMVDCLKGAWGVVFGGCGASSWNWVLPRGAYAFEVGAGAGCEGLNMSSACGLEHRFCAEGVAGVFEEVWKEEEAWKVAEGGSDSLPVIWVPRRDLEGYFAHPGDSFREMARLWAKAGFCRVREHPSAVMIWWGEVGAEGTLLYDRPNHDWRMAAPLIEKTWKKALFGNPRPPVGRGKYWFFWPRRPELVEKLVAAGEADAGWENRKSGLVFYGKIENKVQERRRTTADWQKACEDWVCVRGDEAYPFTQEEYLRKLSGARFGLCLPGYGLKCHREVECMAMGCVPVCAPEVDMDAYENPPVEGVHYFRVKDVEEALAVVARTDKETWEKMSVAGRTWWRENCSVEGSFKLTQRLVDGE